MRRWNIICFLLAGCIMGATQAGTLGQPYKPSWHWVSTLSAGSVWAQCSESQTFFLTPEIERSYQALKPPKTLANGELFLGVQHNLNPILFGQFGLAVAAISNVHLAGIVWEDADPQFDNFTYKYKIQHAHIAAKTKLLMDAGFFFIPWISASAGVGFNNTHDFDNTPTIFEAIASPNFASNRTAAFTYTFGAGMQKAVTEHWQVGLGYEFADCGKSTLGPALGQTMNAGLKLSHLYTNGLLLNLTYIS